MLAPTFTKITFSFDDAFDSDYNLVFPVLSEAGYTATSFIPTSSMGEAQKLTVANLLALNAGGWEIASHSVTHPDLSSLTYEEQLAELSDSKDWITSNIGVTPESFAYPGGTRNAATIELAMKYYKYSRGALGADQDTAPHPYRKYAMQARGLNEITGLSVIQNYIDIAIGRRQWLIMYFHQVKSSGAAGNQTNISTIQSVVDYVKSKNLPVCNFKDGFLCGRLGVGQNIGSDYNLVCSYSNATSTYDASTGIFELTTTVNNGGCWWYPPCMGGASYNYSFDIRKTSGTGTAYVKIINNNNGVQIGSSIGESGSSWVTKSGILVVPSGCTQLKMQYMGSGIGTYEFRNFSITPTVTARQAVDR